jgi:hypothetical protein
MLNIIKTKLGIKKDDSSDDGLMQIYLNEGKSFIEYVTRRKFFYESNFEFVVQGYESNLSDINYFLDTYPTISKLFLLPWWDIKTVISVMEITPDGDKSIDYTVEKNGIMTSLNGSFINSRYRIVVNIGYLDNELPGEIQSILSDYVIWKLKEMDKDFIGLSVHTSKGGSDGTVTSQIIDMKKRFIEQLTPLAKLC